MKKKRKITMFVIFEKKIKVCLGHVFNLWKDLLKIISSIDNKMIKKLKEKNSRQWKAQRE